jgi:hypothetical protein
VSDDDLREVAGTLVERIKTMGQNNPLSDLRNCLNRPNNLSAVQQALTRQSANGVNTLLRQCGVSVDFPKDSAVPAGFTISDGAGAGAEVGVVTGSVDQYLHNF